MDQWQRRQATITKILTETKSIAVVGFSSRVSRAGYYVPAYLQESGYRIIPVNPFIESGLGEIAYPDLRAIPHLVDLVLIFRRSEDVLEPVQSAIEIGAKAVWMQLGIFNSAVGKLAEKAGLQVVMDACMSVEHRRWRASRWEN